MKLSDMAWTCYGKWYKFFDKDDAVIKYASHRVLLHKHIINEVLLDCTYEVLGQQRSSRIETRNGNIAYTPVKKAHSIEASGYAFDFHQIPFFFMASLVTRDRCRN